MGEVEGVIAGEFSYLASHYSDPDPLIRHSRYVAARRAAAWLFRQGTMVFSPILHCHDLAHAEDMPSDANFWQQYNNTMLYYSEKLLILATGAWQTSVGVAGEVKFAEELGIPIRLVTPAGDGYLIEKR